MPKSNTSTSRSANTRGSVPRQTKPAASARASASANSKAIAKPSPQILMKPPKQSGPEAIFARGAMGILVFGVGLILFISLMVPVKTGFLLSARSSIQGTMGRLSFWFPLIICWTGLLVTFSAKNPVRMSTVMLIGGLIVCIAAIAQVSQFDAVVSFIKASGLKDSYSAFIQESYRNSTLTPRGGGALGALIAYPLTVALAGWGADILLVCLMIADFLMLFRVSAPVYGEKFWAWMLARWNVMKLWALDYWSVWKNRRQSAQVSLAAGADGAVLIEESYPATARDDEFVSGDGEPQDTSDESQWPTPPARPRIPAKDEGVARGRVIPMQRPKPVSQPIEPVQLSNDPPPTPTRLNDPSGSKKMFIEDIVHSETERPAAPTMRNRRRPDELPSYLDEQRKRYDALDVIPESSTIASYESDADEDAPPWEPLPLTVETVGANISPSNKPAPNSAPIPFDLEPATFAQPTMTKAAPPAASRARVEEFVPPDRHNEPEPTFKRYADTNALDKPYRTPPFELLNRGKPETLTDTRAVDQRNSQKLEETMQSFGIAAKVVHVTHGPAITRYEVQPGPGVKVSRITALTDDIALNMAALGVRIEAPIPGKSAVGIEIPNDNVSTVLLRDVLESEEAQNHPSKLAIALGKDIAGKRIIANLSSMPHMLIAGATGSGKSVCINTIITSLIYRATPQEVRLILVDPKVVELSVYNGIPHLEAPVVTDPKEAAKALKWAVIEMEDRYRKFAAREVRDIKGFNAKRDKDDPLMPQIVVVIDELADLMLVASKEVEESICRLAQLARAAGIHLVIATQRPSVNVITGVIKSNIPSRIAFAVASQVDARTILDTAGAEKLIGRGDMLYAPSGGGKPLRVQGCFVSDQEVARVVDYVKERHEAEYSSAVVEYLAQEGDDASSGDDAGDGDTDELLKDAAAVAMEYGQASISMLQRRLRVGYARAGRLIDEMARRGIISQAEGVKPRQTLVTAEEFKRMFR